MTEGGTRTRTIGNSIADRIAINGIAYAISHSNRKVTAMTFSNTILSVPVRCTDCGFSTPVLYALAMHSCSEYRHDTESHCLAFPYCSHTADTCGDAAHNSRVTISHNGWTVDVWSWHSTADDGETPVWWITLDAFPGMNENYGEAFHLTGQNAKRLIEMAMGTIAEQIEGIA